MNDFGSVVATLVAAATIAVPITSALVALIKTLFPQLKARYYPTVAVACGMATTCYLAYLAGVGRDGLGLALGAGFLAGLMASGLFRSAKEIEKTEERFYR